MTSDASIVISIKGDVSGGKVVKRTLDEVANSGDRATSSVVLLEAETRKADSAVKSLEQSARSAGSSLSTLGNNIKVDQTALKALSESASDAEKNMAQLGGSLRLVGGALGVAVGAFALLGLANENARASAKGVVTEFGRLIGDIEQATGAGDVLIFVFEKMTAGITLLRAGIRTIPSIFQTIGLSARLAFIDAAKAAESFLNTFSKGVESATFGLRKARVFDLTSGLSIPAGALDGLKTYKQNLEEIRAENELLSAQDQKKTTALQEQKSGWDEVSEAIKKQNREIKALNTEISDMFFDVATGVQSFRDTAISAISDIAKNLLRLSFGGEASTNLGGTVATTIFGGLGGDESEGGGIASIFGFDSGGSMVLGGNGGIDNNVVSLNGQPIMNTSRGETLSVSPNSKSDGGVNVYQTINVSTGVKETVRAEIIGLMPEIQKSTKAAVEEDRQRGIS